MKAFIHVVEIIVILISVLIILTQFSYIPRETTSWDSARIMAVANDILFSLDRQGVNWFDPAEVEAALNSSLPSNLVCSVRLNNVIKPLIRVGCMCSPEEFADMKSLFSSFSINGEVISYNLSRTDPASPVFSTFNDVYIVFDYNLTPFEGDVRRFLSHGKGIVEIRDMDSQNDVDRFQEDVFGLVWDTGVITTTDKIAFSDMLPENIFYNIKKYFYHIPNSSGQMFQEPHTFDDFLEPQEHAGISGKGTAVILKQQGSENAPACAARINIMQGGNGRSAWLSGGPLTEERGVMIKSLVTWTAGESYDVIQNPMKSSNTASKLKILNQDMYQIMEIVLKLGYLY